MRLFKDNGIGAEGKILPLDRFRLFSDLENKRIDPAQKKMLLARAERALEDTVAHREELERSLAAEERRLRDVRTMRSFSTFSRA